jgi:tetraacyldisaccharide 4'-kinase
MNEAPSFWWVRSSAMALVLAPISWVYGWVAGWRMGRKPGYVSKVPVLCIGNFIAGGAGKTPTAISIARMAKKMKLKPGFLTRGYRGGITSPTFVNIDQHNSHDVGDEPLLLAACFPTVVSPDRIKGALMLEEHGIDFIVMDDGFQNPSLNKDYSLVVADARRGIGNGFAMPGGPLRANLGAQLAYANAILIIGKAAGADRVIRAAARRAKPVYEARVRPVKPRGWKGQNVLAFAGIADPAKFFISLEQAGVNIVERRSFGDHHVLSTEEMEEILHLAKRKDLMIVTTSKDAVRLKDTGRVENELFGQLNIFEIELVFESQQIVRSIIDDTIRLAKSFRLAN